MVEHLAGSPLVTNFLLLGSTLQDLSTNTSLATKNALPIVGNVTSGMVLGRMLDLIETDYLLLVAPGECVEFSRGAIERMCSVAEDSGAGMIYCDFVDWNGTESKHHPLVDYQFGSVRDTFNFGPVVLISTRAAKDALNVHGSLAENLKWGALYDLRLKLSIASRILRLPEPLYTRIESDGALSSQFDYVDPIQRDYQVEMEAIAAEHLKRIGVWLAPRFAAIEREDGNFPVRASVVIPVRNRARTIAEAVKSALSQETSFSFNVIVVDNHSSDGTSGILEHLSENHERLIHIKPRAEDLGIGGCWNEAIYSSHCGEIAVQLDSDDLYKDRHTLAKIAAKFEEGTYAMVIGSYTIVNFDLEEIPPGLIDHREWTRENGRNNALRINGLGAPRAFYVPILRRFGFPNTSYGEDYAVGLRIGREYEIGRIYESIYYARRWEGNSDAALDAFTANRYDSYKDWLRTVEMEARRRINAA